MAERTGCPILLSLWSYVPGDPIIEIYDVKSSAAAFEERSCPIAEVGKLLPKSIATGRPITGTTEA